MSVSERIAAPTRVRVDHGVLPWADSSDLAIVHVGQSAVVLHKLPTDRLVVITNLSNGLMPGGICVPDEAEFARTRADIAVAHRRRKSLELAGWMSAPPQIIDLVDLSIGHRVIDAFAIRRIRAEVAAAGLRVPASSYPSLMDAHPVRALAEQLARAAMFGPRSRGSLPSMLHTLVGAGPGTTPTGDDVIVGVMAGLRASGHEHSFAAIAAPLPALLSRTTSASRHYLASAIEGQFGEHVHELVRVLTGETPVMETVARAARWGATSGIDLLTGLVATAQAHQLWLNSPPESLLSRDRMLQIVPLPKATPSMMTQTNRERST